MALHWRACPHIDEALPDMDDTPRALAALARIEAHAIYPIPLDQRQAGTSIRATAWR